ncbi:MULTISPECIES: BrnA antitoxin family protein [Glaesserella]|uniref:Cytoplasmic protein n=1 Tax=Glaesserella australis TaxID=2094024 RepID=A0A328C4F8_9PAST|nr:MULTISPECIES: BrnA antitoxin family protein [Glaesserella]AUI66372.1 cytoplasmic protein [Glaesserella sp. 15-184]RAL19414.1 cytoplasmic protein [Glaesserella australis]
MSKIVTRTIDLKQAPNLDRTTKARLNQLSRLDDTQIDTSDIAELNDDFWKGAARNPFYKPVKERITVRIDIDTLHWLKSRANATGQGYQTLLNSILRNAMLQTE